MMDHFRPPSPLSCTVGKSDNPLLPSQTPPCTSFCFPLHTQPGCSISTYVREYIQYRTEWVQVQERLVECLEQREKAKQALKYAESLESEKPSQQIVCHYCNCNEKEIGKKGKNLDGRKASNCSHRSLSISTDDGEEEMYLSDQSLRQVVESPSLTHTFCVPRPAGEIAVCGGGGV